MTDKKKIYVVERLDEGSWGTPKKDAFLKLLSDEIFADYEDKFKWGIESAIKSMKDQFFGGLNGNNAYSFQKSFENAFNEMFDEAYYKNQSKGFDSKGIIIDHIYTENLNNYIDLSNKLKKISGIFNELEMNLNCIECSGDSNYLRRFYSFLTLIKEELVDYNED